MKEEVRRERVMEMEKVMKEVFEAVSSMKRAYATLQEAHCPYDTDKIRVADVAVISELKRLAVLRERFRRRSSSIICSRGNRNGVVTRVREVVAPYEAAVEELKREVKAREVEVENLKEKLNTVATLTVKGRSHSQHNKRNLTQPQPQGTLPFNVNISLLFYYDTPFRCIYSCYTYLSYLSKSNPTWCYKQTKFYSY